MCKIFLFDLDWTLIYTGGAGVRALNHAFERFFGIAGGMKGVSPDGKTDPAIVREMIRVHLNRDPGKDEIDTVCRYYVERLEYEVNTGAGYIVMSGIPELLETLSKRSDVVMGLGTGNLREGAVIKLSRPNLMKYFRFGGYSSDSEDRPTLLKTAADRGRALIGSPVEKKDVFVIGDNKRDVLSGKAIGATTVAVASGNMGLEELRKTEPDFLFKDFSDTNNVIRTLLG